MAANEVSLRLSVKGREELLKTMKDMGGEYEQASRKIEAGSRKSSSAIKTVNAASKEAQRGIEDLSGRAGGLGRVLGSLGPVGIAAGAGIGAMAIALSGAMKISREAVSSFDALGKAADTLQLSTDGFQALKAAAADEGVAFTEVEGAVRSLTKAHSDLVLGSGELFTRLKDTNPQLLAMLRNTTDNDARLRLITQALQGTENATERANIAYAAFGESGLGVARMLVRQKDGIDGMISTYRELGFVVREDVIRGAEDMETRFGHASTIVDLQLKQAFIDLAPFLIESAQLMANVATEISYIMSLSREFADRSAPSLEKRMGELISSIGKEGIAEAEVMKALSEGRSLDLGARNSGVYGGLQQAQIMQYFREMQEIYAEQGARAQQEFDRAASEARKRTSQKELEARKTELEALFQQEAQMASEAWERGDLAGAGRSGLKAGLARSELEAVNAELARRADMPVSRDPAAAAAAAAAAAKALSDRNRLEAEAIRLRKDLGDYTAHLAQETARYHAMLEAGMISQEQYDAAVKAATDELSGLTKAVETWSALVTASLTPTEAITLQVQQLHKDFSEGRIEADLYAKALAVLNKELKEAGEKERTGAAGFGDAERVRDALRQAQFDALSPAEKLRAEQERINALVKAGVLDGEDATDWLEIYEKRLRDAADATGLLAGAERLLDDVQAGRIKTLGDLGRAFSAMLIDMVRDYLASRKTMQGTSILDMILGSGGFGGLNLSGGSAGANAAPRGAHASIGQSHSGGSGRFPANRRSLGSRLLPGEGLQVVQDSETILTASGRMNIANQIAAMASERQAMSGLIGRALTAPAGGGMAAPNIVIKNYAGAEVSAEARQGPEGPEVSIDIKGRMKDMARGGLFDQAFKERYGLRPVGA